MLTGLHQQLLLFICGILLAACSSSRRDEGSTQDTATRQDSETDTSESYCEEQDLLITHDPVNIMFLIDRSGSMAGVWNKTGTAMKNIASDYKDSFYFGYDTFPRDDNCSVGDSVVVDVAFNNYAEIEQEHTHYQPGGGFTPIYCAMHNFLDTDYAPAFVDEEIESYLVVMSDGLDTCGADCILGGGSGGGLALSQLTADLLNAGIRSVAIDFGQLDEVQEMERIAEEGGTPLTDPIEAHEQADMTAMFERVLAAAASCEFDVDPELVDGAPTLVNFYLNKDLIRYDKDCLQNQGWSWTDPDSSRVMLCDDACTQLRSSLEQKINATFGCQTLLL